jgi:hypothetical protein
MTASPGREVDANLLPGAAPGSAKTRAGPDDAGRQDLGDLVEALCGCHEVGVQGLGQSGCREVLISQITYRPELQSAGRDTSISCDATDRDLSVVNLDVRGVHRVVGADIRSIPRSCQVGERLG